jgi:hypothetical protein
VLRGFRINIVPNCSHFNENNQSIKNLRENLLCKSSYKNEIDDQTAKENESRIVRATVTVERSFATASKGLMQLANIKENER